ncbi:hypothetical protein H0194_01870 [Corynebacterium incognita]|uniref:Uncharacterized protein n=1 Tax=Corynebacterium incognita TaxID=2754725 RepID=A0A7G7CQF8_9CORY|nr:hypothetical protein [Corynebacterium incognita]QNE89824.1 hypothetical protein H0194_01870 [Corynebacterium incognita]
MTILVSTKYHVRGVKDDNDVRKALQALFDIFASEGIGQATFEITEPDVADLFVKHKDDVIPSVEKMNAALATAGPYEIVE